MTKQPEKSLEMDIPYGQQLHFLNLQEFHDSVFRYRVFVLVSKRHFWILTLQEYPPKFTCPLKNKSISERIHVDRYTKLAYFQGLF